MKVLPAPFRGLLLIPKRNLQAQLRFEQWTGRTREDSKSQGDIMDRLNVRTPRGDETSEDQKRSSVVPVRVDERRNAETRPPFKTYGNLEMLKFPNFSHSTPEHIRRHLEIFKNYQNNGKGIGRVQQKRLEVLKKRWIRQQFREIIKSGGEEKGKELLDKLLKTEAVENADLFLEELVHEKLEKLDYGGAFSSWARYATVERTISGADQLLEHILRDKKDIKSVQQARIKSICDRIQHLFTPSDAFAECVAAYLVNDKYDEAKILATFYVISPRSFIRPVKRLFETHNSKLFELYSRLFRDIYVPDNRPAPATEEKDPKLEEAYENVKFLLQSKRRKKHKFVVKKPKLKKYEVDPRQLDILMRVLADIESEMKGPEPTTKKTC